MKKRLGNSPHTIKIFFFVTNNLDSIKIFFTLNYKSEVNVGEKEIVNNSGLAQFRKLIQGTMKVICR